MLRELRQRILESAVTTFLTLTLDTVERAVQPGRLDRLQKVVDRVHLECLHGVLVVRSREDHARTGGQPLHDLEAAQPGHVDIEEQHVGAGRCHLLEPTLGVGLSAHDLDTARRLENPRETLERQRLVVNEIRADRATRRHARSWPVRGIVTVINVPPSRGAIVIRAALPKRAARRPFRLSSPWPGTIESAEKPGPSSQTPITSWPSCDDASTRMCPPDGRGAIARFTLFSTSVCTRSGGSIQPAIAGATFSANESRAPSRVRSISG